MQKYKKWTVTQGDNVVFSGSWKKLCQKYNLTDEQLRDLLVNQTFPYGFIKSEIDYWDWKIPLNYDIKGNHICFIKSLIRRALILELENNFEIEYSIEEIMDFKEFSPKLIKRMIKITFDINSRVEIVKHSNKNYLVIVLPHEYHSDVWPLRDFEVEPGHNTGYQLILKILKSVQQSLVESKLDSSLQTKIIYHESGYWDEFYRVYYPDKVAEFPLDFEIYDIKSQNQRYDSNINNILNII